MLDKMKFNSFDDRANSDFIPAKDLTNRQMIGAFYTPLKVASILADWAIRSADECILEPCFGGCDFLEAIRNRYLECGQQNFKAHIFGCDIDSEAFSHLSNRMSATTHSGNFIRADFLSITARHFGQEGFDAVIGNPPYIKNERINNAQKASIKRLPKTIHDCIKGRANLWAYFVMHAMSFLRVGGRMAWVLPGNVLSADYAAFLKIELSKRFNRVIAISVAERLFLDQGTEERTVVLLCEGYRQGTATTIQLKYCSSVHQLSDLCERKIENDETVRCEDENYSLLTKDHTEVFLDIATNFQGKKISEYGTVYIGIVLGDKKFFVRRISEWQELKISPSYIVPIVSTAKYLKGLSTETDDIGEWYTNDQECFLLNTRNKRLGSRILAYLSLNEGNNKGNNCTFQRRAIWHQPDDGRTADAFVTCLNNSGPRVVLNSQKLQATNSVYRFNFNAEINKKGRAIFAVSLLTTFSQLSAEFNGRQLGSGSLKLEPNDFSQILIATNTAKTQPEVSKVFKEVDSLIRQGKFEDARLTADRFIFGDRINKTTIETLRSGLSRVRAHRLREKVPSDEAEISANTIDIL